MCLLKAGARTARLARLILRMAGGPMWQTTPHGRLKPREAMQARCSATSCSHLRADSPCSSTEWPNLKKQSSRFALVSGHAQHLFFTGQRSSWRGGRAVSELGRETHGLMPLGLSSVTNLLCGTGAAAGAGASVSTDMGLRVVWRTMKVPWQWHQAISNSGAPSSGG